MFRSARRPVIFPQADHARFSAAIALAWHDRPPVPFDSFVRGVADHDRGYGEHDNDEIGVVERTRWVEIQRRGFRPRGEDAVVDLSSPCTFAVCSHRPTTRSRPSLWRRSTSCCPGSLPPQA